jgi:sulfide dehydrogenase cytochrome subunit
MVAGLFLGIAHPDAVFAADANALIESCFACHGSHGVSTQAIVPIIAGYSEEYYGFSLHAYQRKERPCIEVEYLAGEKKGLKSDMCEIVNNLSDSDIELIGAYFAKQEFVRSPQAFDAELAKKGKAVHLSKCDPCHTQSGTSPSDNIGIVGGQKMDYLREQIKFVRDGRRFTSKKMKVRLDSLSDAELEAVVHYYGSIQ